MAASFAKYVEIKLAPALLIHINCSIIILSWSNQPLYEAALIIAYSPDTWKTVTGISTAFLTSRTISK